MAARLTISAHQQRETLKWRGLRAAAQEGYLHMLSKTKDSKDIYVIGDLEKLQVKIQNAEAEAATKTTSMPTSALTPNVAPSAPSDIGDSAKVDNGGTDESVSMDVEAKGSEGDVKPVVAEPSPATGAPVITTGVAQDVEMAEAKAEVKMEEQFPLV